MSTKYHGLEPGTVAYERTKAVHDLCEQAGLTPGDDITTDIDKLLQRKNAQRPDGDIDHVIDRLVLLYNPPSPHGDAGTSPAQPH